MDGFTDIRSSGWVRHLPQPLVPYAILARFDRPIGAWLLWLPGLWGILLAARTPAAGLRLMLLFVIGALAMRGAGCVVNDLWDRKLDAQVERTRGRPLASGVLRPSQAMVFLAILLTIGLLVLLQLNLTARILGVLSLVPVGLYPLAKRFTDWPQLVLGLVFGWGAPMGYAAAAGGLHWPVLWLYGAAILWIIGYDTIYAHQDREDDALIGVRSTARLFGARTGRLLWICYGGMMILLATAMLAAKLHTLGLAVLLAPGVLLARQISLLDINNPALCLALFKSNQAVGLAVGLAIFIGRL